MKYSVNECIKIILLYLKDYINKDQFIELFFSRYDDFKAALRDDIFWNIIDTNFTHNDERVNLDTKLSRYLTECYHISMRDINDAYVENLIEEREDSVLCDMLSKNYYPEPKEEETLDFSDIFTQREVIDLVRIKLGFPESCTNWDAIHDMVYGMWYPKKIIIINWELLKDRLPDDAAFLKIILSKAVWDCRVSKKEIAVEYR